MSELGAIAVEATGRRDGEGVEVLLRVRIPPGTHIEAHEPPEDFLIPTVVEVPDLAEATIQYPAPTHKSLGIPGAELAVYEGEVRFVVRGEAPPDPDRIRGTVFYQPCVGGACLPPRAVAWEAALDGADQRDQIDEGQKGVETWPTS